MKKDPKKSKPTDTEDFNGSLFNLSPDPVIILQDWKFAKVSPSFLKIFGVTQSQIGHGLSMPDFIPEEDLEYVRKRYEERISGEKKLSDLFVFKAYKPSGEIVHLQATSAAIERPSIGAKLIAACVNVLPVACDPGVEFEPLAEVIAVSFISGATPSLTFKPNGNMSAGV